MLTCSCPALWSWWWCCWLITNSLKIVRSVCCSQREPSVPPGSLEGSATAFNSSTVDCTTGLLMLTVLQATSCVRPSGSTASLRLHAKMIAESSTQPLSWFWFLVELSGWVSSCVFCGYFSKNLFFFPVSYSTKMTGCEPPHLPTHLASAESESSSDHKRLPVERGFMKGIN